MSPLYQEVLQRGALGEGVGCGRLLRRFQEEMRVDAGIQKKQCGQSEEEAGMNDTVMPSTGARDW